MMNTVTVVDEGRFYFVVFDEGSDSRQYRKSILGATDSPMTDREETINALCAAHLQLRAEVERLKAERNKVKSLLAKLMDSHSNLSQAEYNRNPSINDSSPIFAIELEALDVFKEVFGVDWIDAIRAEKGV